MASNEPETAPREEEETATFKVGAKGLRRKIVDNRLDLMFKGGCVDRFFKVTERGSNLTTELRAGTTTFLTAAYIMAVNPNILSTTGLSFEGVVFATAASSCVATLIMALWANLPFGLWPGMGMNAYFAYTVVGFRGTQQPVKYVMFCVFWEGIIFVFLSLIDARRFIFKFFPTWMMKATMAGIGGFLAFIGLQAGNGIDLIRDHPAILVDIATLNADHYLRTWLGIAFFLVMATLVHLKVRGAVMIGILIGTFVCWALEGAGQEQFVYEPMCCLGTVEYNDPGVNGLPETYEYFPKPGGGWLPKPTCANAFTVPGEAKNEADDADGYPGAIFWEGSTVASGNASLNESAFIITGADSSVTSHDGSLLFSGNWSGRDSSFKGGCDDVCHALFGGFNLACFDSVMVSTGCWSGLSYQSRAENKVVVDGYGEGCLGGAGRIPKTFKAPTAVFDTPKVEKAGDLVEPYPGFWGEGCPKADMSCGGMVDGGTVWAWGDDWPSFDDLTWDNFYTPLLTLLYVDFLGTMGFLYAAADLSGLIDPAKPHTFPGCYAAFMADAVGTVLGGVLGTSSVTTYGESMAGVYEGGRTGLTALVIAFFNAICIFLSPLFSSIPTLATGPALVMVGVFMFDGVKDIDWSNYMQAVPSLVCILLQITTYKIECGILGALLAYAVMMILSLQILVFLPFGINRCVWRCLPGFVRRFIENQNGDDNFKAAVQDAKGEAAMKDDTGEVQPRDEEAMETI